MASLQSKRRNVQPEVPKGVLVDGPSTKKARVTQDPDGTDMSAWDAQQQPSIDRDTPFSPSPFDESSASSSLSDTPNVVEYSIDNDCGPPPHDETRDFNDGRQIDWSGGGHFSHGDRVRVMSRPTLAGTVYRRIGRSGIHMCGVLYDKDGPGAGDWRDHAESDLILNDAEVQSSVGIRIARMDERKKQLRVTELERELAAAKSAHDFATDILARVREAPPSTAKPFANATAARQFARAGDDVDAHKFARRYLFFRDHAAADHVIAQAEADIAAATDISAPKYLDYASSSHLVNRQMCAILDALKRCDDSRAFIGSVFDSPRSDDEADFNWHYIVDFVQKEAFVQAHEDFLRAALGYMTKPKNDYYRNNDDDRVRTALTQLIQTEINRR